MVSHWGVAFKYVADVFIQILPLKICCSEAAEHALVSGSLVFASVYAWLSSAARVEVHNSFKNELHPCQPCRCVSLCLDCCCSWWRPAFSQNTTFSISHCLMSVLAASGCFDLSVNSGRTNDPKKAAGCLTFPNRYSKLTFLPHLMGLTYSSCSCTSASLKQIFWRAAQC